MTDKCTICGHTETETKNDEINCSNCGFILKKNQFEQPWQQGERDPHHENRKAINGDKLGGARYDTSNDDARNSQTHLQIIRADKTDRRRGKPSFHDKIIEEIESMDIPVEAKTLIIQLFNRIEMLEPEALGRIGVIPKDCSSQEERRILRIQTLILIAMQTISERDIDIGVARFRDQWSITNAFEYKVRNKCQKIFTRAAGMAPISSKNPQDLAAKDRRRKLHLAIKHQQEILLQSVSRDLVNEAVKRTQDILHDWQEPIYSPNSEMMGPYCNKKPEAPVFNALKIVLEELEVPRRVISVLRRNLTNRRAHTNVHQRSLASVEEE